MFFPRSSPARFLQSRQRSLVDVCESPLAVHGEEGVGDALENVLDPPVRFLQRLFRQFALGDVLADNEDDHIATGAPYGADGLPHPEHTFVLANLACLPTTSLSGLPQAFVEASRYAFFVFFVENVEYRTP